MTLSAAATVFYNNSFGTMPRVGTPGVGRKIESNVIRSRFNSGVVCAIARAFADKKFKTQFPRECDASISRRKIQTE